LHYEKVFGGENNIILEIRFSILMPYFYNNFVRAFQKNMRRRSEIIASK
jgi:hypothetical protein